MWLADYNLARDYTTDKFTIELENINRVVAHIRDTYSLNIDIVIYISRALETVYKNIRVITL